MPATRRTRKPPTKFRMTRLSMYSDTPFFTVDHYRAWRETLSSPTWVHTDNYCARYDEDTQTVARCAGAEILHRVYGIPNDILLTSLTISFAVSRYLDRNNTDHGLSLTEQLRELYNLANIFDRYTLSEETRSITERKRQVIARIDTLIADAERGTASLPPVHEHV